MSKPPVTVFRDVCKAFGERRVLSNISFEIQPGEVFFIMGGSGAANSVLIKHLVGLVRPASGDVWLETQEVSRLCEREFYDVRKRCTMRWYSSTRHCSIP